MKRAFAVLVVLALLVGSSYTTYVWGWYRGMEYHSVIAGMSEAKVALSAARSLRQSDPELALELLEANISWMNAALHDSRITIPESERANFEIVLASLRDYYDRYSTGAVGGI